MINRVTIADNAPKCAEWALERRVELGGTAGHYDGYLLVEWPLPWPRDAADVPALSPLRAALSSTRTRLQLIYAETHPSSSPRLIYYRRNPSLPFDGYRRIAVEAEGGLADVPPLARQLLEQSIPAATTPSCSSGAKPPHPADVLVCAHGARDICCGSAGTKLARHAAEIADSLDTGVRVWRTTHLGGHRFAPTAVTLPDGIVWGRLDEQSIRAIIVRDGPARNISHLVRGCSGIAPPSAQVLDRALLAEYDWPWLRLRRAAETGSDAVVRIRVEDDQDTAVWDAYVAQGRDLPIPDCRAPLTGSEISQRELMLVCYRRSQTRIFAAGVVCGSGLRRRGPV